MKTIESEITINASVDRVWSVLMDFTAYPDWNAFIPYLTGNPVVGSKWKVTIHPPGGSKMKFSPVCTRLEYGKYMQWKGNLFIPGLFDGQHNFSLMPIGEDKTLLKQFENFSGILVPVLWKSLYKKTLTGFNLMNQQLKYRVEKS